MRKKLLIYFIIILSNNILGNPIIIPQAKISEFLFDEHSEWYLEISFGYFDEYYSSSVYDSIKVESSAGIAKIRQNVLKEGTTLLVINADSLNNSLSIDKNGDYIKVYSYLNIGETLIDSIIFGNYPGSCFNQLKSGQSICRVESQFSKDNSPTIGFPNDTLGTCGTLNGFIFDKNNNSVTDGIFEMDFKLNIDKNGFYSTRVLSRNREITYLYNLEQPPGGYLVIGINPISINIEPDTVLNENIHLLKDYVGVEESFHNNKNQLALKNFPNPFNSETYFLVEIPNSIQFSEAVIKIYNINGQLIKNIELIDSNFPLVKWNGENDSGISQSSGIYIYHLILDSKIYKSGSMVLLK